MRATTCLTLLCMLAVPALGQQPAMPAFSPQTLAAVEAAVTAARQEIEHLNIDILNIKYSDGKDIEYYKQLLNLQLRIAADNVRVLKEIDSLTSAVLLSQALAGLREAMRDLTSVLQNAGENATSAAPVRAAIPLVRAYKALDQPSSAFDEQLLTIIKAADSALNMPRRRTPAN